MAQPLDSSRAGRALRIAATMMLFALCLSPPLSAARERLALRYQSLELPGAPVAVVPADVNQDGIQDLVIVVAFTEWDRIAVEQEVSSDEVEGLVEMLTVVPALFDRRQLYLFLGNSSGGLTAATEQPLDLDTDVLAVEAGPPGLAVVALTDAGLSQLVLDEGELELVPFLFASSVLGFSGALLPKLDVLQDVDGDGAVDLMLPTEDTTDLYFASSLLEAARRARATGSPVATAPSARLALPERAQLGLYRRYPVPEIADVNGDGHLDLIVREDESWRRFAVLPNLGPGRYGAPIAPLGAFEMADAERDEGSDAPERVAYFGDLDGDSVAEYVVEQDLSDEDAGFRKGLRQAKRPPMVQHLHRSGKELSIVPQPYRSFETVGYSVEDEDESLRIPGGFQDLDGDGRLDLITVTLDFSIFQAIRVLVTRSVSLGLDFHIYCQGGDGSFGEVPDLDLSGKFKLRLDDLRLGQLSQFAGDFDGDGRADFVQMGRGRKVTIHRGLDGCRYAPEPDLVVELAEEPKNLALVQVRDLDGDGLADLLVLQPGKAPETAVTPPVRIDLYLSGHSP